LFDHNLSICTVIRLLERCTVEGLIHIMYKGAGSNAARRNYGW
jgi:hypothetical protein